MHILILNLVEIAIYMIGKYIIKIKYTQKQLLLSIRHNIT